MTNPVDKSNQVKDKLIKTSKDYIEHLESLLESRDEQIKLQDEYIEALKDYNKILKKITELELPLVEKYEKALLYGEDLSTQDMNEIILLNTRKKVVKFALVYQQNETGLIKLTKRELEVVEAYVQGIPRMEVARGLGIGVATLKGYEKSISKKFREVNDKDFSNDDDFDFYKDLSPESRERIRAMYTEQFGLGNMTKSGKWKQKRFPMKAVIVYNKKANKKLNAKKMSQKITEDYSEAYPDDK